MIQCIIIFPLELQRLAFRDSKDLSERKIHVEKTRAAQRISSHLALPPDILWSGIGVGIEPEIRVRISHVRIANLIGTILAEVRVEVKAARENRRESQSGFECGDATEVPPAENEIHGPAPTAPPRFGPER